MITIIPPAGDIEIREGGEPSLDTLQSLVGGYIELVTLEEEGCEVHAICNEEGLLKGLPFNPRAEERVRGVVNTGPGAVGTWVFLDGNSLLT